MSANPCFSQAKLKEIAEATVVRQEKENKQLEAYRKKEKDRGIPITLTFIPYPSFSLYLFYP
jgi:hypothetical protein